MPDSIERRCQDIAIFKFSSDDREPKQKSGNPFVIILATVLVTVLLIAVGYLAGLKAGLIAPPDDGCCFGVLDLNFEFDASDD